MFNTSVLIAWLLISSNINLTVGVEVSQDSNETRYEEETSYEQVQDPFEGSYDDPTWRYVDAYDRSQLKDWGFYNYSSDERYARRSIVEWGGKTYDSLSFKGEMNNTYAIAFHLSTEVAVSAAQARNGTIFDVAEVNGSDAYKALMVQMQLDLKSDRSAYYALPYSSWTPRTFTDSPFLDITLYMPYFSRLYRYLTRVSLPPRATNPIPIFTEVLTSILNATENALRAKLNTTSGFFAQDKIYMRISSPFALNHTYTSALRCAMSRLDLRIHNGNYGLLALPPTDWFDHSNDEKDYSGANGTALAFEQARRNAAMSEFDETYRPGDFRCGTGDLAGWMKEVERMKRNGTWVEPPMRGVLDFECENWRQCWTTFVWEWDWDGAYDEFEFEGMCQL